LQNPDPNRFLEELGSAAVGKRPLKTCENKLVRGGEENPIIWSN
jgi:hypothetical protein